MIPYWLKNHLNADGIERIEATVAEAELKTSGEIVPVIVSCSSTVGHVPLILFLAMMALGWFCIPLLDLLIGGLEWSFWQEVLVTLVASIVLAFIGARWTSLQRVLVPLSDRKQQVFTRAQLEFYRSRISETRDSTGVLIFVSLLEKQVVVLADKSIDEKMNAAAWQEVMNDVINGIKDKDMVGGFTRGIHRCGEILSEYFPIKPDDTNELPNKLVIRD